MLLLNIFDFEFSLHDEKNVKRSSKCSSSTHKTDKKCCSKCSTSGKTDHIEKDVYCKHCFVSKFLCKDGSFKCCSQCANCVNCNKSKATAPCINNEVRNAINIISVMRNMLSHDEMMNWTSKAKSTIPTEFKFCAKTADEIWDACKRATLTILEYLKSKYSVKDTWYRQKYRDILDLDRTLHQLRDISLQTPKKIEIKISIKRKLCFVEKLFIKTNQGIDSELESVIADFLETSFRKTLEDTKCSAQAGKYRFDCINLSTNCKRPSVPFKLQITPREKHRTLDPDFESPTSSLSSKLWKNLHWNLMEMAKSRGFKIEISREEWIFNSIDVIARFKKDSGLPFDIFEMNGIFQVIRENHELEDLEEFNLDVLFDEELYKLPTDGGNGDENDDVTLTYIIDIGEMEISEDVKNKFTDHFKEVASSKEGI